MCVRGPPVVLGMNRILSSPSLSPGPKSEGARKSPSASTRAVSYAKTGIALGHIGGLVVSLDIALMKSLGQGVVRVELIDRTQPSNFSNPIR